MKHTLKADKVKYSPNETKLFVLLGVKAKSTTDLIKGFYGRNVPVNGRKILIGVIRSLRRKLELNKQRFKLASSDRSGPHSMEFWLEAK